MSGNDYTSGYENEDSLMSEEGPLMSVAPAEDYSDQGTSCVEPESSDNMSHRDGNNSNANQTCYNYLGTSNQSKSSGNDDHYFAEADNIYLMSMPEPGEPLICGTEGDVTFIDFEDSIPITPHSVLGIEVEHLQQDNPIVAVMTVDADGAHNPSAMTVAPGSPGTIYWHVADATHVQINGEAVEKQGFKVIEFDKKIEGSSWPYEIVAWRDTPEKSTVELVDVYMQPTMNSELDFEITIIPKIQLKEFSMRYVKGKFNVSAKFKGKFSQYSGSTGFATNWNQGEVSKSLSEEFKFGDFSYEPNLEFKIPIKDFLKEEKDKSGKKKEKAIIEVSGGIKGIYEYTFCDKPGKAEISISIKTLEVVGSEEKWKLAAGDVDATFSTSLKVVDIEIPGYGKASGTLSASIKGEFEPNWPVIYAEIAKYYGADLAASNSVVAVSTVAGVVTSPAFILTSGLACITISSVKLYEALEIGRYASVVIPGYSKQIKRGAEDGLRGQYIQQQLINIEDDHTAYLAGAFAGNLMRQKYEENSTPFDDLNSEEQNKKVAEFAYAAEMKMKKDVWVSRAAPLTQGSWLDSDYQDLRTQEHWWMAIFGKDPIEMGEVYVALWKQHRVQPDEYSNIVETMDSYNGRF